MFILARDCFCFKTQFFQNDCCTCGPGPGHAMKARTHTNTKSGNTISRQPSPQETDFQLGFRLDTVHMDLSPSGAWLCASVCTDKSTQIQRRVEVQSPVNIALQLNDPARNRHR